METPFPAYKGDDDFVFTCYSHRDSEAVYKEIQRLHELGVNIWYDEGIRPGSEWTDELANAIRNCKTLLFFATPRAIESKHCRDEIQYASKFGKHVIVIYLEPTELPPGLDLTLGALHAVEKGRHEESRYFDLLLEAINDPEPGKSITTSGPTKVAQPSRPGPLKRYGWLATALVLGITLLTGTYQLTRPPAPSQEAAQASVSANSVALLPFEDRGGFDEDNYYPESLSEDLLNRLVAIDGLQVASRRASFVFRPKAGLNLVDVANNLGVGAVIVGYIRRSGEVLRLSLELIDVTTGVEVVLWSNSYDNRPMDQMLVIQSDVTSQIARTFFPDGLSQANEERLARISTSSPEAYQYYLQARDMARRPVSGSTHLEDAARLFEQAIELDGEYAWARAGLCAVHRLAYERRESSFAQAKASCEVLIDYQEDLFDVRLALGQYYQTIGEIDQAMVELDKATKLNSNSADAKLAMAQALADRFSLEEDELDRVGAEQAYLEAISVEPSHWYTYHAYATFLTEQARLEDAKEQLNQALALAPGSIASLNNLAGVLYRQGRTEDAEAHWQRSLEVSPDNRWALSGLGILYHYDLQFEKAVATLTRATQVSPDDHVVWGRLGESYRLLPDKQAEARETFMRAIELAEANAVINPKDWELRGFLALYYAYVGDFDAAQSSLQRMFQLNLAEDPMSHYWAALIAYEQSEIDQAFAELDRALAAGFDQQKRFITDEPSLAELRRSHKQRFEQLISRY